LMKRTLALRPFAATQQYVRFRPKRKSLAHAQTDANDPQRTSGDRSK
jgi:hypothetical protein